MTQGQQRVSINSVVTDVVSGEVRRLEVSAGGGNDSVDLTTVNAADFPMLVGASFNVFIHGGPGNDHLRGSNLGDTITGGIGSDVIWGNDGNDHVFAGSGDDVVFGAIGTDLLYGEADSDQLWGGPGEDTLRGGFGNDAMLGEDGNDRLIGGAGNDTLKGMAGADEFGEDPEMPDPDPVEGLGSGNLGDDFSDTNGEINFDDQGTNSGITSLGVVIPDRPPVIEWIGSMFYDMTGGSHVKITASQPLAFEAIGMDPDGDPVHFYLEHPASWSVDQQSGGSFVVRTPSLIAPGAVQDETVTVVARSTRETTGVFMEDRKSFTVRSTYEQDRGPAGPFVETSIVYDSSGKQPGGQGGICQGVALGVYNGSGDGIRFYGDQPQYDWELAKGGLNLNVRLGIVEPETPLSQITMSATGLPGATVEIANGEVWLRAFVPPTEAVYPVSFSFTDEPGGANPDVTYFPGGRFSFDIAVAEYVDDPVNGNPDLRAYPIPVAIGGNPVSVAQDDIFTYRDPGNPNLPPILDHMTCKGGGSVLENDSGKTLSGPGTSTIQGGTVNFVSATGSDAGKFSYTPPSPTFTGWDSFSYTLDDDPATVNIFVYGPEVEITDVKEVNPETDEGANSGACSCGADVHISDFTGDVYAKYPIWKGVSLNYSPPKPQPFIETSFKRLRGAELAMSSSIALESHFAIKLYIANQTHLIDVDTSNLRQDENGTVLIPLSDIMVPTGVSGVYPYYFEVLDSVTGRVWYTSEVRTVTLNAQDSVGVGAGWTISGVDRLLMPSTGPQALTPDLTKFTYTTGNGKRIRFSQDGRGLHDEDANVLAFDPLGNQDRFYVHNKHGQTVRFRDSDGLAKSTTDRFGVVTDFSYLDPTPGVSTDLPKLESVSRPVSPTVSERILFLPRAGIPTHLVGEIRVVRSTTGVPADDVLVSYLLNYSPGNILTNIVQNHTGGSTTDFGYEYEQVRAIYETYQGFGRIILVSRNDRPEHKGATRVEYQRWGGGVTITDEVEIVVPTRVGPFDQATSTFSALSSIGAVGQRRPLVNAMRKKVEVSGVNRRVGSRIRLGGDGVATTNDEQGRRLTESHPDGSVTNYVYDPSVVGGTPKTEITTTPLPDGSQSIVTRTYDAQHNLSRVDYSVDGSHESWEYQFQPYTYASRYRDRSGRVTEYQRSDRLGGGEIITATNIGNVSLPAALDVIAPIVTTKEYAADGLLELEIDARGIVSRYEYTLDKRFLTTVTSSQGTEDASIVVYDNFDAFGNARHINENGRVTLMAFDSRGRRTTMTSPDPGFGQEQPFARWEYRTSDGQLFRHIRSYVGAPSSAEVVTDTLFDSFGRVRGARRDATGINATSTSTFDVLGNTATSTDEAGRVTTYLHDRLGNVLSVTGPDADGPGPLQPAISYTGFDGDGRNVISLDPLGNVTRTEYDFEDRVVGLAFGNDAPIRTQYLPTGEQSQVIDPLGRVTSWYYDRFGRLWQTWLPDPNPLDAIPNQPSLQVYDAVGNLRFQTDELGRTTEYQYDFANRPKREIGPAPDASLPTHRPESSWRYFSDGSVREIRELVAYDNFGLAIERTSEFSYDGMGRPRSTILPADPHNGLQRPTTTRSYFASGQIKDVTDPLGNKTAYQFDKLDRLTRVIGEHWSTRGSADLTGKPETEYIYHPNGGPLKHVRQKLTGTTWRTTTHRYDGVGRLVLTIQPDPVTGNAPPDSFVITPSSAYPYESFVYDAANNIIARGDSNQTETMKFSFVAGRYLATVQVDGNGATVTTTYDRVGRRISLTDPATVTNPSGNTTTWQYDDRDRMVRETNVLNLSRFFTYDLVGALTTKVDRNGRTTRYEHDGLSRVIREIWEPTVPGGTTRTLDYSYDLVGQLLGTNDPDHQSIYKYDLLGRVDENWWIAAGLVDRIQWNSTFNLDGSLRQLAATNFEFDLPTADYVNDYGYDNLLRLKDAYQHDASGTGPFRPVTAKAVGFHYDLVNQPTTVQRYEGSLAGVGVVGSRYDFDRAGRLRGLTHVRGTNPNSTNPADRLAAYTWEFNNANRLHASWSLNDGSVAYEYDPSGQLTDADYTAYGGFQRDESYDYDAAGNRISVAYDPNTVTDFEGRWSEPDSTPTQPALDESGNERHAERIGDVSWVTLPGPNVPGEAMALQFDGVGDYLTVADSMPLAPGAGDYSFALRVDLNATITQNMVLFSHGNGSQGESDGLQLEYQGGSANKVLKLSWNDGVGKSQQLLWNSHGLLDLGWHHLAVTIDQDGPVILYVDGVAYRAATNAQSYGIDPTVPLTFGATAGTGTLGYHGLMDDIRVYHQALTPLQVSNLALAIGGTESFNYITGLDNRLSTDGRHSYVYDGEGNRTARIHLGGNRTESYSWDHRNRLTKVETLGPRETALFSFNSDTGASLYDDVGVVLPGSLLGDAALVDADNPLQDKSDLALAFDGNLDFVALGIQDAFDMTSDGLGLTAWIRPTSTQGGQTIVNYGSFTLSAGYRLTFTGTAGAEQLVFAWNDGVADYQQLTATINGSLLNQWHHVAVSVDRAGLAQLYLDGTLVASATSTQMQAWGMVTDPFLVGAQSSTTGFFTGRLDDVRVYDRPMTQAMVQSALADAYPMSASTQIVRYTYDASNQMISRSSDPDGGVGVQPFTTEYFLYERGQIVLRLSQSGDVTHRYLWSNQVDQLLADESVISTTTPDNLLWTLTDHLGTVRDVGRWNTATAATLAHRVYDAFGNVTFEDNLPAIDILFGYTGRPFDKSTGLQNNLNRWYDPGVGRWISEDPIGFAAGDANLYRYVGNAILTNRDSDGLRPAAAFDLVVIRNRNQIFYPTLQECFGGHDVYPSNDFGQPAFRSSGSFSRASDFVRSTVTITGGSVCNTITGNLSSGGGDFDVGWNASQSPGGLYELYVYAEVDIRQGATALVGTAIANGKFIIGGALSVLFKHGTSTGTTQLAKGKFFRIHVDVPCRCTNSVLLARYRASMRNSPSYNGTNTMTGFFRVLDIKRIGNGSCRSDGLARVVKVK